MSLYSCCSSPSKHESNDYMADGLHPKDAGYAVMANTWWDAIGTLLPSK